MSNIIDSIKLSGVTYTIQGSGGGGNPTVELTQAQYDSLVTAGTVAEDTYYIITDAQAGDLTQYWTSAQTNSAITEATSGKVDSNVYTAYTASTDTAIQGKQDALVSGTNIKTINNESLLGSGNITIQGGGGGKAISAGTNISITTGETADTINCTLPITISKNGNQNEITFNNVAKFSVRGNASGAYAVAIGEETVSNGTYSIAIGYGARANSNQSISCGYYSITNNKREFSTGSYNNSVSASTTFGDSGNTLFSVGNGTSTSERHNAFEIRENGDIYITSGGTDIKLQDNLGGGSITVDDMLSSTSTNPVQNKVVKSATDRICNLFGYGTSGQTDMLAWATGATSNVIDNYVQFSKINGKKIIGGRLSPTEDFSLVETSAITTSVTSSSTDAQVPSAKAVNDKLGGLSVVKLTESEYTALVTKDSNTLYVVVPDPSN